ncbi:MAG: BON domain-containing protein [Planctomycetota bacterium]
MMHTAQRQTSRASATPRLRPRSATRDGRLETAEAGVARSTEQFDLELAELILQRIEAQLPGRIRHLTVFTTENAVILAGQCSTFYSKQLAQHAAMGVLDYEQLINNIDVRVRAK